MCNELGIYAIGIDISAFNSLTSDMKIENHDLRDIAVNLQNITKELKKFQIVLSRTINRLHQFDRLGTNTYQNVLQATVEL